MRALEEQILADAASRRRRIVDDARAKADKEFVAVVRRALREITIVEVAKRAGVSRETVHRLLRLYPEGS